MTTMKAVEVEGKEGTDDKKCKSFDDEETGHEAGEEEEEEQAIDLRNRHRQRQDNEVDGENLPPGPKSKKAVMLKKLAQRNEEAEEEKEIQQGGESPPAKRSRIDEEAEGESPVQIRGTLS